ncbi:hypothetical protein JYK21_29685 [Ralstonia pickettii]|nr:hypothetical protein [Ralstonia pickettii]
MMEVLRFVFSSFWVWAGTVILVGVAGSAIGSAIGAMLLLLRRGGK